MTTGFLGKTSSALLVLRLKHLVNSRVEVCSMKKLSLIIMSMLIFLQMISTTSTLALVRADGLTYTFEPAGLSEGSLENIVVSEDVSVLNGSYGDINFIDQLFLLLGTGFDGMWWTARSWLKFNLSEASEPFYKATMYVRMNYEWGEPDEPVGVYYCDDDSWTESTLTWNLQPAFAAVPSDVIDSPASPDMFVDKTWYGWEITNDVRGALAGDKMLTEVLKQTVEIGTQNALDYYDESTHAPIFAAYIELSFTNPAVNGLTTSGYSESPLIDYIQDASPTLGWEFSDPDVGDYQRGHNVEVWDTEYYNGTQMWNSSSEDVTTIYSSALMDGNYHPFGMDEEIRLQTKYPSSELPRSGMVDRLYFRTIEESGTLVLEDFEIRMFMVEDTSVLSSNFTVNYDGREPTTVLSMDLYEVSYSNHILVIDVENIFMLNNYLNLIIEFRLMNNTADITRIGRVNTVPGSVAGAYGSGAYTTDTAIYTADRLYDLKIGFQTEEVFASALVDSNAFPFGTTPGSPGLFQIKYNQSIIDRDGTIDKVYFRVFQVDGNVVFENLTVSVVETPVIGPLAHLDFSSNYGGRTPTVVIDASTYEVRNLGNCLVLDFENTFYYSNTHDLLIELQWDSLSSGYAQVPNLYSAAVCYRAWDVHWLGLPRLGNQTAGYNLMIDFVESESSVDYAGPSLVNNTSYYWRVQTCDSYGFWSDWAEQSFTYTPLTTGPSYEGLLITPAVVYVGTEVTVAVNVTYFLGVSSVSIEFNGSSHPMEASGDTYTYSWTPAEAGTLNYTIYMVSTIDTSTSVEGSIEVLAVGLGGDITTLLIIIGAAAVVIVVAAVVLRMRGKPAT